MAKKTPMRPLHKDSPMEQWNAQAADSDLTGEELRRRTLAADDFLLEFFFPSTGTPS